MEGADELTSSSSSSSATASAATTNSESEQVHVLAVDDSLVDRKVIEKLLKITSCKGTIFFLLPQLDFEISGTEFWC